jgi:hypothetical protein
MLSGVSPNDLYGNQEYYRGCCFAIPVPQAVVDAFCNDIQLTQVYELLRSPICSGETAWDVFAQMVSLVH